MPDDVRMPEMAIESAPTLVDLAAEADRLRQETEKFQAQLKAWGTAKDTDLIVNQTGHAGRIAQQFGQISNLLRERGGVKIVSEPKGSALQEPAAASSELPVFTDAGQECIRYQITRFDSVKELVRTMKPGVHYLKTVNDGKTVYTFPLHEDGSNPLIDKTASFSSNAICQRIDDSGNPNAKYVHNLTTHEVMLAMQAEQAGKARGR